MDDYSKDVKIFKALCDEKRLAILNHLKSGEKCACVDVYKRQQCMMEGFS